MAEDDGWDRPVAGVDVSDEGGPGVDQDFATFYDVEFPKVSRVVRSLVGRRDIAEEISQDAFIVAYDRWTRIRSYDRPGDFVRRVALNRAVSDFRRRGAERRAIERASRRGASHAEPRSPSTDEWLWREVRRLPDRQAQAIALTYAEDLSVTRVAEILGCSENTVKTHLTRARRRLAQVLQDVPELNDGERG